MNGGAVTIVYDGDGNRVAKTASGVTTRYLVVNLNPTGYPQVMDEVVNGAVQREYTYGLQRISQNQVISGNWTPSFYGYDGAGSVRFLTNAAGIVTDAYEYDAFGVTLARTGTTPNVYMYRGEQYDSDLGLYYMRARYYNSLTGRFLSRDPEAGKPVDPKTLHKYLYAGGDPINRIDPNGHADLVETALNFAAFGVRQIVPIAVMACQLENLYQVEYMLLNWYIGGPFTWGDPRIPGPVAGACALAGLPWVPGPEPPPPPEPPFPWPPPGTPVN